ncbi:MAG: 50S ribosomal protein L22 [Alphaproteobacteria bacterium]|nr:50S ribosomal protein L22 [Alphaproteobacteria bacterium]
MSKPNHPRTLAETEAKAVLRNIRVSPRKLGLVAGLIRGMKAGDAVAELTFSRRRIAHDVRKVLQSAIANAENNHQLDVDRLVVKEASVGKSFVMKRFDARGRGRAARVVKPFSHLTIVVGERQEKAAPAGKKTKASSDAKETA